MRFIPSPTGKRFIRSRAFIKGIMGPVGGGKSTVCLMDLVARAHAQDAHNGLRRTKFAIVRNTAAQLWSTVKPLIDEWLVSMPTQEHGAPLGSWRLTDKTFEIRAKGAPDEEGKPTEVFTELVLLAADTPDDVRRLLSLQLSAAWAEEAREIDPEILKGLLGRVDRFPAKVAGGVTYPGVIFSTNAPMVDTYWQQLIENPPENAEVFIQPAAVLDDGTINPDAENLVYLSDDYYPNLIAANTKEWVDVYLKNKFGPGNAGLPVYRASFKRDFHVSKVPLLAIPSQVHPLIVGCDNGLQGAAVVLQQDARARVNVLSEAYVPKDTTMGWEKFLDTILIPHLLAKYPKAPRGQFLFVLDPACFQRSQVNEATIAMAVQSRGYQAVKASTNDPSKRVMAVEGLLTRAIDSTAGMLIDPSCTHLAKALEWGYRYKKTASGEISLTFDKNHFSHVCFPAGTTVATPAGPIAIENIAAGDLVDTPVGPRQVDATMSRITDALVELVFDDGRRLVCTPEHPLWTDKGFVRADELQYDANVLSHGASKCDPAATQFRNFLESGTTASPAGTTNRTTTGTAGSTCTAWYGPQCMEKYPQVATSTTSTATRRTTAWRTFSFSRLQRMLAGTLESNLRPVRALAAYLMLRCAPLPSGTGQTRLNPCCDELGSGPGKFAHPSKASVPGAEKRSSGTLRAASEAFAGCLAKVRRALRPALMMFRRSAACAGPRSSQTSTSRGKPAPRLVQRRLLDVPGVRVFDLEVREVHVFYAEGLLVSNCEAHQYGCLHYNAQFSQTHVGMQAKRREVKPRAYTYA